MTARRIKFILIVQALMLARAWAGGSGGETPAERECAKIVSEAVKAATTAKCPSPCKECPPCPAVAATAKSYKDGQTEWTTSTCPQCAPCVCTSVAGVCPQLETAPAPGAWKLDLGAFYLNGPGLLAGPRYQWANGVGLGVHALHQWAHDGTAGSTGLCPETFTRDGGGRCVPTFVAGTEDETHWGASVVVSIPLGKR